MTPAVLIKVGEALFGPAWRGPLAEALRVNERTVRRWAAGESEIPFDLPRDLAMLCRQQGARLGGLAEELEKYR